MVHLVHGIERGRLDAELPQLWHANYLFWRRGNPWLTHLPIFSAATRRV
jgi:hypothetical protein